MKNCQNCGAELVDDAVFCGHCGSRQDLSPESGAAAAEQAQAAPSAPVPPPPPQYQAGAPQAPPHPYAYPPHPPRPPSAIGLEGGRYPGWLAQGILGTTEPMHLLFAAIVPFLISLFSTLEAAPLMRWHAGGFFLLWFFMIIIMGTMPVMAWVSKRYILKEEDSAVNAFARFSSYLNSVLPISLLAFIFGVIFSDGAFALVLMYVVPIFILVAALMTAIAGSKQETKKLWLATLTIAGTFFILLFLYAAIFSVGIKWGW